MTDGGAGSELRRADTILVDATVDCRSRCSGEGGKTHTSGISHGRNVDVVLSAGDGPGDCTKGSPKLGDDGEKGCERLWGENDPASGGECIETGVAGITSSAVDRVGVVGDTGADVPKTGADAGPFETVLATETLTGLGRDEVRRGTGRGLERSKEAMAVGVTEPLLSDSIVVVELEGVGLGGKTGSESNLYSSGLYRLKTWLLRLAFLSDCCVADAPSEDFSSSLIFFSTSAKTASIDNPSKRIEGILVFEERPRPVCRLSSERSLRMNLPR